VRLGGAPQSFQERVSDLLETCATPKRRCGRDLRLAEAVTPEALSEARTPEPRGPPPGPWATPAPARGERAVSLDDTARAGPAASLADVALDLAGASPRAAAAAAAEALLALGPPGP